VTLFEVSAEEDSLFRFGWMSYECACDHVNGFGFDKQSWVIDALNGMALLVFVVILVLLLLILLLPFCCCCDAFVLD
jgi:hypothetical protein